MDNLKKLLKKNSSMQRAGCEISHSCDNYDDYKYFIQNEKQPVGLHHHDHYELIFFLSGELEYHIENRVYRIQPGDLLLISPAELHQPIFVPAKGFYERIVLWIEQDTLLSLCQEGEDLSLCFNNISTSKTNLLHPAKDRAQTLLKLFEQLVDVTHRECDYSSIREKALLGLILAEINILSKKQSEPNQTSQISEGDFSKYTVSTLNYIAQHLGDDLNLDILSRHCYISPQHLLRVFKKDMGISVHSYIAKKRLLMAHQYLKLGNPASLAAQLAGFSNYATFWRAYKKEYGISPSEGGDL